MAAYDSERDLQADVKQAALLHDSTHREWQRWLEFAGVTDVDASRSLIVDDKNVLIQAAIEGRGVALATVPIAQAEIKAGRLVKPRFTSNYRWNFHTTPCIPITAPTTPRSVLSWSGCKKKRTP